MSPRTTNNFLITGHPGIGKTTVVDRLVRRLESFRPAGFITTEIREQGVRKGFELRGLDGRRARLSHVSVASRYRVGKYGVDIRGFEEFLLPLTTAQTPSRLYVIDEIGKMECFSTLFRRWIRHLLDNPVPLLATVAWTGTGLIAEAKGRSDAHIIKLTRQNRDTLPTELFASLHRILSSPPDSDPRL
jgi:nucleoside-triphosphatase